MAVAATKARLVFGFNTFPLDALVFVKDSADAAQKRRLKRGYRVVDRRSDAQLVHLRGPLRRWRGGSYASLLLSNAVAPSLDVVSAAEDGMPMADGLTVSESWVRAPSRGPAWLASLALHVRLMAFMARLFDELCSGAGDGGGADEATAAGADEAAEEEAAAAAEEAGAGAGADPAWLHEVFSRLVNGRTWRGRWSTTSGAARWSACWRQRRSAVDTGRRRRSRRRRRRPA